MFLLIHSILTAMSQTSPTLERKSAYIDLPNVVSDPTDVHARKSSLSVDSLVQMVPS